MSNQSTNDHFFQDHVTSLYLGEGEWTTQENGSKTYSGQLLNAAGDLMSTQVSGKGVYWQKGGMIPRKFAYKKKTDRPDDVKWSEVRGGGFVMPVTLSRSSELFEYISDVERAVMLMASEKKLINNQHKIVSKIQKYESAHTTKFDLDQNCLTRYHVQDFMKPLFKCESDPIPDSKEYVPEKLVLYPSSFSIVSNTRAGVYTFYVKFRLLAFTVAPRKSSEEVFEEMIQEPQSAYQRAIARLMSDESIPNSPVLKRPREVTLHQPSDDEIIADSEEDDEPIRRRAKKSRS